MSSSAPRLFEYFLVIRLSQEAVPETRFWFRGDDCEGLPRTELAVMAPQFAFPDLASLAPKVESASEQFTFVVTESDGKRLHGFCRRFIPVGANSTPRLPECLCFLSYHPWARLFGSVLDVCQVRWVCNPGAVFPFLRELLQQPLPPPGGAIVTSEVAFTRNDSKKRPDVDLAPLFKCLSVDNVLLLFSALLCEKRVVLTSASVVDLFHCVHACLALLYPLDWPHMFVPVAPQSLLNYACAPMPFVMGVQGVHVKQMLELPLEQLVIVNLDKDQVHQTQGSDPSEKEFDFSLPPDLSSRVAKALRGLGEVKSTELVSDIFLSFFVVLFHHGHFDLNHCVSDDRGKLKFDTDEFLADTEDHLPDLHPLLAQMRHSQMFERFVAQRIRRSKDFSIARHPEYRMHRFDAVYDRAITMSPSFTASLRAANDASGAKYVVNASNLIAKRKGFSGAAAKSLFQRIRHHDESKGGGGGDVVLPDGDGGLSNAPQHPISTTSPSPRSANTRNVMQTAMELTSNAAPHRSFKELLQELYAAASDASACRMICDVIWLRLGDCERRNWKHAHRGLGLLDRLLRFGSDFVTAQALDLPHRRRIHDLISYAHSDSDAQRKVRKAARSVWTMVGNIFQLRSIRKYPQLESIRNHEYRPPPPPRPTVPPKPRTATSSSATAAAGVNILDFAVFDSDNEKEDEGESETGAFSFNIALEEVSDPRADAAFVTDMCALRRRKGDWDFYRGVSLVEPQFPLLPQFADLHEVFSPHRRWQHTPRKAPPATDPHDSASFPALVRVPSLSGVFDPFSHSLAHLEEDLAVSPRSAPTPIQALLPTPPLQAAETDDALSAQLDFFSMSSSLPPPPPPPRRRRAAPPVATGNPFEELT